MHLSAQSRRVTPTILSLALIILSPLWFVSARVFYLANQNSKDGIFQAPVWVLFLLLLIPASTFLLGPELLKARRMENQPLKAIDYWALAAGIAPFAFLAILLVLFFPL